MSDARRYAVWPDPRSRSRLWAIQSWKSFHLQQLSRSPFTMGAGNWPPILKLEHNMQIWSGQIFDICPSFCVTWLWTWQKCQLWRVDCQSRTVLIYLGFFYVVVYFVMDARLLCCVHFSFSVLSQEIVWEERPRNDLFCVGWDVKP